MSLVFAVEAWIVSIIGWAVLTLQEMWAWSLLSAHVFYSFLLLSTCNLVLTGLFPDSKKPKLAYFATVMCFSIHSCLCAFDAIPSSIQLGERPFRPPSGSNCTLARVHQVHFFTDSSLFLIQAGNTLGYLIVQLLLSGASVLDPEIRTLWPGSMWGNSLSCMISMRLVIMFDSTVRGVQEAEKKFLYLMFFSEPLQELEILFMCTLLFFITLMALRGCDFLRPVDHWYVLLVNSGGTFVFTFMGFSVMYDRSLLTLPMLISLILPLIPASYDLFEALMPGKKLTPLAAVEVVESVQPQTQLSTGARVRHYIPVPIQLDPEKSKMV
jgi:hypothetical protein